MKTVNAVRTVDMIRRASKAADAYHSAQQAVQEAHDEQIATQAQLSHWHDQVHAASGTEHASHAHTALLAASHEHNEAQRMARARPKPGCSVPP
ncbi:hypothetical protein [Streptomyces solaniscabiei]|uniref:hypothetical protein n=1 Tax=Streptomyces solaniscabiei TaxID=2683255 RepID=UPI001CE2B894|nr:hypothetical protein [Streptomyces solaniscabiei]